MLALRTPQAGRVALALTTTAAGHWRIMNAAGEPFTAANPAELEVGLKALAPHALGRFEAIDFVLPPASVFEQTEVLTTLPGKAGLLLADGDGTFRRIVRPPHTGAVRWHIDIGDGLQLAIGRRDDFTETRRVLARPITRETVRVLSIAQGGPTSVPRRPLVDATRRIAKPDAVDPEHLAAAFSKLTGQTVLVLGRAQGGLLAYIDSNGREGSIPITLLEALAAARDVDLLIVSTTSVRQPGSRNLLYQQVVLGGLDKAVGRGTLGSFVRAIAGDPPVLSIAAERIEADHLRLRFALEGSPGNATGGWSRTLSGALNDLLPETTGALAAVEIHAVLVGSRRHSQFSWWLLADFTAPWRWSLLAVAVTTVAGSRTAWRWWGGIWPAEARAEYGSRIGHLLAQAIRSSVFLIIFLPLAGLPAIGWQLISVALHKRADAAP